MIVHGKANINDPRGTVNDLYFLDAYSSAVLMQYKDELIPYLDMVDKLVGRQQAKELSKSIRKKITS